MTERYGYGYRDRDEPAEDGVPVSRRGAVTERRPDHDDVDDDVREIDLTDADQDAVDLPEADAAGERAGTPDVAGEDREPGAAPATERFAPVEVDAAEPGAVGGYAAAERADEPGPGQDEGERRQGGAVSASRVDLEDEAVWTSDADQPGADRGDREAPADAGVPAEPAGAGVAAAPASVPATSSGSLLASVDAEAIRRQFLDIQAGFVDEPRQAVQQAGALVDDLVQRVLQSLTAEREQLVDGADADTTSTEDLRLVLRAYRAYVDRLLGLTM
jgi:hypothetical protein